MANLSDPVARQYANALYELAHEQGCIQQVFDDLSAVDQSYREDKVFRQFFTSPKVPEDTKLKAMESALSGSHDLTRNFIGLLIRKNREPLIDNIMDSFSRYRDSVENRVHVHVDSAKPLESDMRDSLTREIAAATKKDVVVHENVDASLIGGLRLRMGDLMLDSTLKSRLSKLARAIAESSSKTAPAGMANVDALYEAAKSSQ